MSIIRILPDDISNRIAAGEVIERPASVVKELMENSIDAGASSISVKIENAGKRLIMVTDDGSGMDSDDALLCFEPHATSKIKQIDDIDNIKTMGFRGEAMPSIASVSRLKMKTRKKSSMEGLEVNIEGGRFISAEPVGCAPGTEIAVQNLFFNTPARRKFLKTDNTEEKHIIDMFCSIALAHPLISFNLILNGTKILSSSKENDLTSRIKTFYGKTLKDALIPLSFSKSDIFVEGYIARHGYTRKSRKEQRVYINSRPIESQAVYRGIKNGYDSLVMKGTFPPVFLMIEMPPSKVDFNVHPAKREVRFREPGLLVNVIEEAIKKTVRESHTPTIAMSGNIPFAGIISGAEISYTPEQNIQRELPIQNSERDTLINQEKTELLPEIKPEITIPDDIINACTQNECKSAPAQFNSPQFEKFEAETDSSKAQLPAKEDTEAIRVLAFLDETYILGVNDSGLVIIDQHAAHERILFEKFLKNAEADSPNSQKLLIPVTLELSKSEFQFLKRNLKEFRALGFDVEPFGSNTVIISAFPSELKCNEISESFAEILHIIIENGKKPNINKSEIAKAACKKAVKAHDKLSIKEAESLIQQMNNCILPYSCPHGRPTIISISYKELEKRFGRI
jgi:DNA mismatch repair protein MutL